MKKAKIILDIIMIIGMLTLMNLNLTGIKAHEILGITIFIIFIIHKVMNINWIKAISKNIFNKNIKTKTKIMYWIDIILLISIITNIITGILISKYILTGITVKDITITTKFHHIISFISLSLIAIHISFHLKNITTKIKKILKKTSDFSKIDIIVKIIYSIIAITTIYILIKSVLVKNNKQENQQNLSNSVTVKKEDDSESQTNSNTTNSITVESPESIEEYLSKLFCTGCGRHCPLTSPQCGRGMSTQTEKIQEYNETYNTNETYTNSNNRTNTKNR